MAWAMRRLPSSAKGRVTTATVSTLADSPPSWLAMEATTGAAPVRQAATGTFGKVTGRLMGWLSDFF